MLILFYISNSLDWCFVMSLHYLLQSPVIKSVFISLTVFLNRRASFFGAFITEIKHFIVFIVCFLVQSLVERLLAVLFALTLLINHWRVHSPNLLFHFFPFLIHFFLWLRPHLQQPIFHFSLIFARTLVVLIFISQILLIVTRCLRPVSHLFQL